MRGEQIAGHMGVSACRGSSLLALLVMAAFAAPRSSTLVLRGASRAARLGNDMLPEIWLTASLRLKFLLDARAVTFKFIFTMIYIPVDFTVVLG